MTRAAPLARRLALLALIALVATAGCKRRATATAAPDDAPAPIVVTDKSEGLLLTWIDEKGDFHVEQKPSDVPIVGRDAVRVVDPGREDGTHEDRVYVADLRNPRPDGTFPVRAMSRAEFEAMAVARRQKNAPTLASAAPVEPPANDGQGGPNAPPPSASAGRVPQGGAADPSPAARPAVIIYGASWCGACHDAAAYLRKKGIPFVEKDIESDPRAAQEMKSKLARAGLRGGSIPVLDVRGRVMVGFNPRAVDDALGQAL